MALQFSAARGHLDGVSAAGAFTRDPHLGLGTTGPHAEFETLTESLAGLMHETATTMNAVGHNLVITAQQLFGGADSEAQREFKRLGGTI